MSDITEIMVTCPVCKSTCSEAGKMGFIVKKMQYRCSCCGTELEQSGSGQKSKFKVTKVGQDYSNADGQFTSMQFSIEELKTHSLPIIADAQLVEYANGNLEGLTIQMAGDAPPPVILKKGEKIEFYLAPINYLEERAKRVTSGGGRFSVRVTSGLWYHTPRLSESQYASSIEYLDSGTLVLTNKRYIFLGHSKSVDQPFTKVSAIKPFTDGVAISRSNKQKTEYYTGGYHWPFISAIILGLAKNANQ